MSLVLRFHEQKDFETTVWMLHFDAVTDYSRSIKGSVAKHPVDKDGEINDHFSSSNTEYRISGIVSHADISLDSFLIKDERGVDTVTNYNGQPYPVTVTGGDGGLLSKLIPDSVGQFIPSKPPEVLVNKKEKSNEVGEEVQSTEDIGEEEGGFDEVTRVDQTNLVRDKLMASTRHLTLNDKARNKSESIVFSPLMVEIYRFDRLGNTTESIIRNLILTDIEEKENAETSGALFLDLTLEEVRFSSLEEEVVVEEKKTVGVTGASKTENLGTKDTVVKEGEEGSIEGGGRELTTVAKVAKSAAESIGDAVGAGVDYVKDGFNSLKGFVNDKLFPSGGEP